MLNKSQERAVDFEGRFLQIIAGPGTGKTLTLAARIERVIERGETSPEKVLALTFTNNAVSELKARLKETFGEEIAGKIRVMTYHAFSTYLISIDPEIVGLTPQAWESADEWDQQVIFSSLQGLGSNVRSRRNKLMAIKQAMKDLEATSPNEKALLESYRARVLALQMIDYDTMLEMGHEIVQKLGDEQFDVDHVFLDEFQDNAPLQWEIVSMLVRKNNKRKLTVVGDPNQEIYQFVNHWKASSFTAMDRDFPESEKVYLDQSYRSSQEICDLAAEVVDENNLAPPLTAIRGYTGTTPSIRVFDNDADEFEYLSSELTMYLKDHPPASAAVLVRTNADVDLVAKILLEAGIPVETFFSRALLSNPYVRLVHCLFKQVTHPNDVYLFYLFTSNESKILSRGHASLLKTRLGQQSLRRAVESILTKARGREAHQRNFDEFYNALILAIEALRQTTDPMVVQSTCLTLLSMITKQQIEIGSSKALDSLFTWIDRSSQAWKDPEEPLVPWITNNLRSPSVPRQGFVNVHTIHAAKGLEWDAVFMPRVQVGHYPFPFNSDLSQEKKALFVGLTRARSRLVLSATGSESSLLQHCKSLLRVSSKPATESVFRKVYPKLYAPLPQISHQIASPQSLISGLRKLRF